MSKVLKYKNPILEMITKEKRRREAYTRQELIKRIKSFTFLFMILSTVLTSVKADALPSEDDPANHEKYEIGCFIDSNMYIKYDNRPQPNYEYFYYSNDGEELPAYCIELGVSGAEDGVYSVSDYGNIGDVRLNEIILSSYPYRSIEELGLASKSEAKFASQFAIWCYLSNLNIDLISPISQENERVVAAIKSIYSGEKYIESDIEISSSSQKIEIIEGKTYYSKEVVIKDDRNIKSIALKENEDSIIDKIEDNKFKIYIPIEKIINSKKYDYECILSIKEKNSLLGQTTVSGRQNVILMLKNTFEKTINFQVEWESISSKLIIKKYDEDTKEPIQDVKFLLKENNNVIGEFTTNKDGEIILDIVNDLKITNNTTIALEEIEAPNIYNRSNEVKYVNIEIGKNSQVEISNSKKKGTIKIIKRTSEYNEYTGFEENTPLSNVKFNIYDKNMNLVDSITTNENGIALSKKLIIGEYYIKEIETNKHYKILDELVKIQIDKDSEEVYVTVLNENINVIKELPKTGK